MKNFRCKKKQRRISFFFALVTKKITLKCKVLNLACKTYINIILSKLKNSKVFIASDLLCYVYFFRILDRVNFTNILFAKLISNYCLVLLIFWKRNIGAKVAFKILLRLITDVNLTNKKVKAQLHLLHRNRWFHCFPATLKFYIIITFVMLQLFHY